MIFGGIHCSFYSHNISCDPSCHNPIIDPPPCFTVGKVFICKEGFTLFSPNIPSLVVVKKLHFVVVSPKHIVPKGFRFLNVFFCIFQMHNFALSLFFLATLPCRSLLFVISCGHKYVVVISIVVLGTARPKFGALFCSSFAIMWGFF